MADAQQAAAAHTQGLTRRDLALASKVVQEGRALLILLNKLDALPEAAAIRVRGLCVATTPAWEPCSACATLSTLYSAPADPAATPGTLLASSKAGVAKRAKEA